MAGKEKSPDRNHFGKRVLDISERAHRALGHTAAGRAVTSLVAGSSYDGYRQLDWYSRNITSEVKTTIKVPGDPKAGPVPRFWKNAAVLAAPSEEVENLRGRHYKEAVAYLSEGVLHVGALATEWALLEHLSLKERAIAMRLGRGPLEATMGIWLPNEKHFISVENIRTVEESIPIDNLAQRFARPGLALV